MSDTAKPVKPVTKCPKCGKREFDVEMIVMLRVKCTDDRVETAIPVTIEELARIMDASDAVCNKDAGGCGAVFDTATGEILGYQLDEGSATECGGYPDVCENCHEDMCEFAGATAEQLEAEAAEDAAANDEAGAVDADGLQSRADDAWRNLLQPGGAGDGGEQKQ